MNDRTEISTSRPCRGEFVCVIYGVEKQVENVLEAAILAERLLEDWTELPDGVRYLVNRIIDHGNDTDEALDKLRAVISRLFPSTQPLTSGSV
jgi:hypothetical protein